MFNFRRPRFLSSRRTAVKRTAEVCAQDKAKVLSWEQQVDALEFDKDGNPIFDVY